jgi:amino acid transporter
MVCVARFYLRWSPWAQSASTMAPTTISAATIPPVCALAGNGTCLAYVLATAAVLLVALCIARYARHSSSHGSLYAYASPTLPPWLSATVAWSLLLAYVVTGSSVIGGFYHYGNLLPREATGHVFSLTKITKITERSSLKFTFDICNVTNTAGFDIPIDDLTQNINFNGFPAAGQSLYVSRR